MQKAIKGISDLEWEMAASKTFQLRQRVLKLYTAELKDIHRKNEPNFSRF